MRYFIVVAIFVLLVTHLVADDNPSRIKRQVGTIYFGAYTPSTIKDWSSIPEPAKSRIVAHLKNRLGDDFYAKVSLVGGEIIDIKALREKEPNSKDYRWEVPAYRLKLRFSRPEIGIDFYDALMDCRSDGSVITEIDLPEIAKHPERARFISTSKAVEIAKRNGFDVAKARMTLEYRDESAVCVFLFEQEIREDGAGLTFKCIDIDAHNGKVLKTFEAEAFK